MLVLEDSWPAVPASVSRARSAVGAFALDAGLPDGLVHNLKVAVSEAATNVVIHAYVGLEPDEFSVWMAIERGRVEMVVRDRGRGMVPRADSPGLGLGLPLIANLAESVEVAIPQDGGTEVRMRFRLSL
jgi:serine/threonine-protein kinase RsbW/stage II sporulation protein AB (anti-sigma F factor)